MIKIPKSHQLQIAVFSRKNYIDSERNYIKISNLKKQNKARINVLWLGKYNPFFVFQDSVFTIPKHNVKTKKNFFLNVNHGEKLCFTEFNTTRIYWNRSFVASGLLFLFTQSNKFSKFNWHMLRKRLFIKLTENEERLLLSASLTTKFTLVLVLTQENAFS